MAKTVAVVGASSDRSKFGNKAVRAFLAEGHTRGYYGDLVHNAKAVPLTDQVRIDREEIYDILDQMRATIPEEIKQAQSRLRAAQAAGGQNGKNPVAGTFKNVHFSHFVHLVEAGVGARVRDHHHSVAHQDAATIGH